MLSKSSPYKRFGEVRVYWNSEFTSHEEEIL
jgi:hypothetical protein